MKSLKIFFADYLSFSKSERNGIFILLIIIAILVVVRYLIPALNTGNSSDFAAFNRQVVKFENALVLKDSLEKRKYAFHPDTLFTFNPNHTSTAEWKKLGLNDKQIRIIQNYLSKGGKFYDKEDFKKIYGITEAQYSTLAPYIHIPQRPDPTYEYEYKKKPCNRYQKSEKNYPKPEKYYPKPEKVIIEINGADTAELQKIKGIGPVYAGRIQKYRYLLGGFVNKKQLLEVYGINGDNYPQIAQQVRIDTGKIQRINLNDANYYQLVKHPYIDQKTATAILKYRKKVTEITTPGELIDKKIISGELLEKLKLYFH